MNDFPKIVRDFKHVADFVVVYVCEAHPTDEWDWHVSFLLTSVYALVNTNLTTTTNLDLLERELKKFEIPTGATSVGTSYPPRY